MVQAGPQRGGRPPGGVVEMRKGGLIRSQRGYEGGYWLGRPAEEITLLDISRVVDGELLTLRGESLAALDYPGAATALPDVAPDRGGGRGPSGLGDRGLAAVRGGRRQAAEGSRVTAEP